MSKLIAGATEEVPTSKIWRLNYTEISSGELDFKTITADSPDGAIGRLMDMLGLGLLEPEEFWDKYKVTSIIEECKKGDF